MNENENRITGPGYYPRRPTKVQWHRFAGRPWVIRLWTPGTMDLAGQCPWFGAGTYTHVTSDTPRMEVGLWQVIDRWSQTLYEFKCPVAVPTIGIVLHLDNPEPANLRPTIHWSYTAKQTRNG